MKVRITNGGISWYKNMVGKIFDVRKKVEHGCYYIKYTNKLYYGYGIDVIDCEIVEENGENMKRIGYGQRFQNGGREYILAQVDVSVLQLIGLRDGNRWSGSVQVVDKSNLSKAEISSLFSDSDWRDMDGNRIGNILKLGEYIPKIRPNGDVLVGCQTIKKSEVKAFIEEYKKPKVDSWENMAVALGVKKIDFQFEGRKTICMIVSHFERDDIGSYKYWVATGTSSCSPSDTYSRKFGKALAFARAMEQSGARLK